MAEEAQRTHLIGELASLLREPSIPDETRAAAMHLIGWLARRMPGESASQDGVAEMLVRARALRPIRNPHHQAGADRSVNGRQHTNGAHVARQPDGETIPIP